MSKYYDWDYTFEKHPADMYMVVSARGIGKTYGLLKNLINKIIENDDLTENGARILYLRRNKIQATEQAPIFWQDFQENQEWPDLELTVKGDVASIDGLPAVEIKSITDDMKLKGSGHATIKYIIYDEFIPGGGSDRYKKNEEIAFQSILSTYIRDRETKVYMLANSLSYESIYYDEFHVRPVPGQRYNSITFTDDETDVSYKIVVDHPLPSDVEITAKVSTKMGVLFKNTSYGAMALGNEAPDSEDYSIESRDPRQKLLANVKMSNEVVISVWAYVMFGKTHLYFDTEEKNAETVALTSDLMGEGITKTLLGARTVLGERMIMAMLSAKNNDTIRYRSISVRIRAIELMRNLSVMQ